MNVGGWIQGGLIVVLGIVAAVLGWNIDQLRGERDSLTAELDSLELDADARLAELNGWTTAFGNVDDPGELHAELAQIDSARARALEESRVAVRSLTRLATTLRDSIRIVGTVLEEPVQDSSGVIIGAWRGEFEDDLFSAVIDFRLPSVTFDLTYSGRCPGVIVQTEAADRILVSARGLDPRCTPELGEVFVDPPQPEVRLITRSLWSKVSTAAIWGSLGYLARSLTR